MKFQILFSGKIRKIISSAEFAQRVVKVNRIHMFSFDGHNLVI